MWLALTERRERRRKNHPRSPMLSRVDGRLTDRSDMSHTNLGWLDWRDCFDWQQWCVSLELGLAGLAQLSRLAAVDSGLGRLGSVETQKLRLFVYFRILFYTFIHFCLYTDMQNVGFLLGSILRGGGGLLIPNILHVCLYMQSVAYYYREANVLKVVNANLINVFDELHNHSFSMLWIFDIVKWFWPSAIFQSCPNHEIFVLVLVN